VRAELERMTGWVRIQRGHDSGVYCFSSRSEGNMFSDLREICYEKKRWSAIGYVADYGDARGAEREGGIGRGNGR
jgi:hypothetical protein